MEIFFESDREVIGFCENLFQQNKQLSVQWTVNEKWGNKICVEADPFNELKFQAIAQSMAHVYLTYRFSSVLIEIIKDKYYFTDKHEIQHIHELAEWIVTGEDADSLMIRKGKHPIQLLRAIFLRHIRNTQTIHFDSIVQFGMKIFKEDLVHYVGLAIDEFKREEEHQTFIHTLREFVKKKESTISLIHILEGETFTYYNGQGRPLSKSEITTLIKKEPLYLFGLSPDEWNLTPLIALAPLHINMYVADSSNPKIQTVINVFQERVTLKGINEFPYYYLSES